MPTSRSRSPPRRRSRYTDDIPQSSRERGYGNRGYGERSYDNNSYDNRGGRGRRDNDRRDRRRDDDRDDGYSEKSKFRRGPNEDRGKPRRERPPTQKSNDPFEGPSSRPRSPGPSRHSKSKSRSRSSSVDKTKPNFNPSGLLAAETNTVTRSDGTSTFLKYNEPPEARKPSQGWRLYVFKGKEQVDLLHIHRQSAYLVGRDRVVSDIPVEHPSCSKQHAAIQFRHIAQKDELGNVKATVKPFIIDLESTNGTLVNDETIPPSRYYELKPSDVIKFGQSLREYVLLHDDA
ncbi:SMAD/FHA domain-containing protein [Ramaria rubella]|nr:SMAD/FHA domain-containing protein [Ramaria rubella]